MGGRPCGGRWRAGSWSCPAGPTGWRPHSARQRRRPARARSALAASPRSSCHEGINRSACARGHRARRRPPLPTNRSRHLVRILQRILTAPAVPLMRAPRQLRWRSGALGCDGRRSAARRACLGSIRARSGVGAGPGASADATRTVHAFLGPKAAQPTRHFWHCMSSTGLPSITLVTQSTSVSPLTVSV
jgi:hypothetical protein